MKKIISLLAMATVLFASSCSKTTENVAPEKNETPITLSPEFADLQNSLYELNQEMVPSLAETRGWWTTLRWIVVGVGDVLGGVVDYQENEKVGSAIVAGANASIAIFKALFPKGKYSESINDLRPAEREFESTVHSLNDSQGALAGLFHNSIIRNAYNEVGDELFEMNTEQRMVMFSEEMPDEYQEDLSETSEVPYDVQDFVYSPESGETIDEFFDGVCEKYPEAAQEILTVKPILEGIDSAQSDKVALRYIVRAMKTVELSNIAAESKQAILCGASIAFESKLLWNISDNTRNKRL